MLEVIVQWAITATPYVLIIAGCLGALMLLARVLTKFAAPAARSA